MGTTIPAGTAATETGAAAGRGGRRIRQAGSRSRAAARAPIPLPGDPRAALRPDRRRPGGPRRRGRDRRCPTACPTTVDGGAPAAEGPRRLRHQRRAAARQEGRACRRATSPSCSPSGSRPPTASPRSRSPGPGFLNITRRRRRPGRRSPRRSSRPARRTAARDALAGEKVNLEFVSANPTGPVHLGGARWAAVGDALGRLLRGDRRRRHPGVLLQRPRRPDRPVRAGRCWPARAARADARGRLRAAQYIAEIADAGRRRRIPTRSDLPDDEAQEVFRARRRRADVRRDQADPARLRRRLRRLLPRERPARVRRRRPGASTRLTRAGQHLREGRRPLARAPRSTATTRTA